MAEAVLLAVSKIGTIMGDKAIEAVICKLSEKVTNLQTLPGKVDGVRQQLEMMNSVIRQIATTQLTDGVVKNWISEVRKLAYHVEDVMDRYSYHALQLAEEWFLMKLFRGPYYVTLFSGIADEVNGIESDTEKVIKLKEQWLQPSQLSPNQHAEIERQQSQDCLRELVKDDDLVGVDGNRITLTDWLCSYEPNSTVITVSGMGGLGKTTLVKNVYEREKVNFPVHMWVFVSQKCTVDALLGKILRKIGCMESADIDMKDINELTDKLAQKLKDSKCLIVLDDVWETEAFLQIQGALQSLQASRIIITTRNDHVAFLAPPTRQLKILPLRSEDAFKLFCKRTFQYSNDHKCPQELKKLATDIVERCEGLPLAIVSIGGLLSSRLPVERVWNQMYNQLQSQLANNDHVLAVLNLSYHDLPGDLRNCFLYCSLFPADYPMSRESLVRMWVAEGFVRGKERSTPEEVAEGHLIELIHRNMLQVIETDELGMVSTCKMHDIVRGLALKIAKDERFGSANDYGTMSQMDSNVRRLSACRWRDKKTALRCKFPRLRTLMALETISSSHNIFSSILEESNYLTVLELQDSTITEVPPSIGDLFSLRYIGLRRTKVKSLPDSIQKLSNLHTLDIKQTKIEMLPRGIVKVKKLRHLLADKFLDEKQSSFEYFMGVDAPKGLSNLEELQTLETVKASKNLAEQLENLMQLRSVWISSIKADQCANLFATLSKMTLLSSLLLSASNENEPLCFKELRPTSTMLQRLIVRGSWADKTLDCPIFLDHGKYLKYLALSRCQVGKDPLRLLAQHLPNLTYLRLNNMHSAEALVLPAKCFPHLKVLVLNQMHDVNLLIIEDSALPCIEALYVSLLSKLESVPQGIEHLRSLKKLWLLCLHKDFKSHWYMHGMHQRMQHVPELRI